MKLPRINLIIALLLAQPVISHAENRDQNLQPVAIVGHDDRVEAKDAAPERRKLAESTVALFYSWDLEPGENDTWLITDKRVEKYNDPNFKGEQLLNAHGSGVLVGDDLVLTAGHMFWPTEIDGETNPECSDFKFVFGYKMLEDDHGPASYPKSDVYSCKEVIRSRLRFGSNDFLCHGGDCEHSFVWNPWGYGSDYALVRLDRKVENNAPPLAISRQPVSLGRKLFAIGYPRGMFAKVANIGAVVTTIQDGHFRHTVDVVNRNSGSPLFDAETLEIVGICISGLHGVISEGETDIDKLNDATSVLEIADLIPETQMERDLHAALKHKTQSNRTNSGDAHKLTPAVILPGVATPEPAIYHPTAVLAPLPTIGI